MGDGRLLAQLAGDAGLAGPELASFTAGLGAWQRARFRGEAVAAVVAASADGEPLRPRRAILVATAPDNG